MNRLQIKETNQELIRELKTRIASKEISKQELTDLTNSLMFSQYGRKKIEPAIESLIKEIKPLLILIISKWKKVIEVNTPWPDEKELLKEYQEVWSNPQRFAEFKQWEQASINDWVERTRVRRVKNK